MEDATMLLLSFGGLLLGGLFLETLGRRTRIPRVTVLLLFGFAIGSGGLDLLPPNSERWFGVVTTVALVMVGFLLGEKLTIRRLRRHGREVLAISIAAVVVTTAVVTFGLMLVGAPLSLALLLGAIAAATAPAATYDVVDETGEHGGFVDTLLGVVALDDAWGLVMFTIALAAVTAISGDGGIAQVVGMGMRDLFGAIALGVALGVPIAFLTHRVRPGEPTLLEALGVVLLCGGLALWLEVSFILAAICLGATTANLAVRHRNRPFHAIRNIEQPFLVLFFVLAGASLEPGQLMLVGGIGAAYIGFRALGRLAGGWVGARLGGSDAGTRRWIGAALMPQAGVALGIGLVAAERQPELADVLLPVVIGATVVFELLGPILTRVAIRRTAPSRGQ
jgi:Kef-type K+ transport system membrane component KefB